MMDEFRVFISSTFRDLQAERAHLLNRIFPELRQRAREAGAEFTEIDLRWGLTTEDAEHGRVIRLCLEEVERCPFFIGILGDRFGWVPTIDDIRKDPLLIQKYPWLEQAALEGWSVTESEMYLGALSDNLDSHTGNDRVARFYAKQPITSELTRLYNKIQDAGHSVALFGSPEELGTLIRADWLDIIHSVEEQVERLDPQAAAHEAFAKNRLRAYIPPYKKVEMIAQTLNDGKSLILRAESGYGKSSLSAFLQANASTLFPELRVFTHFAGASLESVSLRSIVSRMRSQFEEVGVDHPIGNEAMDPAASLQNSLEQIERPTLLLLDAVDQLQLIESELHWLPAVLPKHVRVLITCTAQHFEHKLQYRQEALIELGALPASSKALIIEEYFRGYAKQLPQKVALQIVHAEATSNPIYLRILLEELRLFGDHESLSSRTQKYLSAKSVRELLTLVLTRLESDFSTELVGSVMGSLAIVRGGLTEHELEALASGDSTAVDPLAITSLVHALEYHLIRREGLLGYFHAHIEQAAHDRYLSDRDAKLHIGGSVEKLFPDRSEERSVRELAHLYDTLDRFADQLALLTDLKALPILSSTAHEFESHRYWQRLEQSLPVTMEGEYRKTIQFIFETGSDAAVAGKLGMHLVNAGRLQGGKELLQFATELASINHVPETDQASLFRSYALGATLAGDLKAALSSIEIAQQLVETQDLLSGADVRYVHAHTLFELGRYAEAEPIAAAAYRSFVELFGERDSRSIEAQMGLANVLRELGRHKEAEQIQRDVLHLRILTEGQHSVAAATAMNDLGTFLRRFTTRLDEAEELARRSLKILTDMLGPIHPNRCTALGNLAVLLRDRGKLDECKPLYEEAIDLEFKLHGPRHPKTATALHNYAAFLSSKGELEEAGSRFQTVLRLREEILGETHAETIATMIMLGATHYRSQRFDEAELVLSRAANLLKVIDKTHSRVGVTMNWLGRVKTAKGDLPIARDCFEEALEIRLRDLGLQDPFTADTQLSLGKIYAALGEPAKAKLYLEQAKVCLLNAVGPDDPRTAEVLAQLAVLPAGLGVAS